MSALLEFRNLHLAFGTKKILNGIDLTIQSGETVVLLGRSGSGKTTLLRCANAMLQPTSGQVLFEGRCLRDWDVIRLRRRMGYVIQEAGLFPHFTVERNVATVPLLERWEAARIGARVAEVLHSVGLPANEYSRRYPAQLSGGQRQRVGIARALAADPAMLLLDEPFGALDPVTRFELQNHFRQLRDSLGKTALFVTHDVREAMMMATRIVLLKDGRIDTIATPAGFARAQTPEARAFLASVEQEIRPA